jgi:hypothetical protein
MLDEIRAELERARTFEDALRIKRSAITQLEDEFLAAFTSLDRILRVIEFFSNRDDEELSLMAATLMAKDATAALAECRRQVLSA